MSNTVYRFFVEKFSSSSNTTDFVGDQGEIFWDPEVGDIRISDGVTPGGEIVLSAN